MKGTTFTIIILTLIYQPALADFDCQEYKEFSTGTCNSELQCIYQEAYEERKGYPKYCPCKILISDLAVPNNELAFSKFQKICSRQKTQLKQLWIIDAELEFIDDEIFANYPNLKYLNLAGNRFRLHFSQLTRNITELDISNNGLNEIQEGDLNNLESLKLINASFNRLDKVNFCFKSLGVLEEIYLNNNHLMRILTGDFDHLRNLKVLDLAHNLLVSIETSFTLSNLRELYLNNNELTSINDTQLIHLPNLKILKINNNLISNLSDYHRFVNLEELYVENNHLSTVDHTVLAQLPNLKSLNMCNNKIDIIYEGIFLKTNTLQCVDPSSNFLYGDASTNLQNASFINLNRNITDTESFYFDNIPAMAKLNEFYLSHYRIGSMEECTFGKTKNLRKSSLQTNIEIPEQKVLDFDRNLVERDTYGEILRYFEDKSVVFKTCPSAGGCCDYSIINKKLIIIIAVVVAVCLLVLIGLFAVICKICR